MQQPDFLRFHPANSTTTSTRPTGSALAKGVGAARRRLRYGPGTADRKRASVASYNGAACPPPGPRVGGPALEGASTPVGPPRRYHNGDDGTMGE